MNKRILFLLGVGISSMVLAVLSIEMIATGIMNFLPVYVIYFVLIFGTLETLYIAYALSLRTESLSMWGEHWIDKQELVGQANVFILAILYSLKESKVKL